MKCPGQDTQYWTAGSIFEAKCPQCGAMVEFFKDDTSRKCGKCGHRFVNPKMDFGCAAYCQYAEQCLGNLSPELVAQQENLLKDRVAVEMKRHYGRDFKRIAHVTRVARYADKIGKLEQANMAVALSAAYLKGADEPSSDGALPVAAEVLQRLRARDKLIAAVLETLKQIHAAGDQISPEAAVVADAEMLAQLEEAVKTGGADRDLLAEKIGTYLRTSAGRKEAETLLQTS